MTVISIFVLICYSIVLMNLFCFPWNSYNYTVPQRQIKPRILTRQLLWPPLIQMGDFKILWRDHFNVLKIAISTTVCRAMPRNGNRFNYFHYPSMKYLRYLMLFPLIRYLLWRIDLSILSKEAHDEPQVVEVFRSSHKILVRFLVAYQDLSWELVRATRHMFWRALHIVDFRQKRST